MPVAPRAQANEHCREGEADAAVKESQVGFHASKAARHEHGMADGGTMLALGSSLFFGTCLNAKRQVQRTKPDQACQGQNCRSRKRRMPPRSCDGFVDEEVCEHRGEQQANDAVSWSHVGGHDAGVEMA